MRWLWRGASVIGATAALYAVIWRFRGAYAAIVCSIANLPLPTLVGEIAAFTRHGDGVRLWLGDVPMDCQLPFILVAWPLYLGLAVATPLVVIARPWRVILGLTVLLGIQAGALDAIAVRFAMAPGSAGRHAAEAIGLLLMDAQRIGPVLLWWIQFASRWDGGSRRNNAGFAATLKRA